MKEPIDSVTQIQCLEPNSDRGSETAMSSSQTKQEYRRASLEADCWSLADFDVQQVVGTWKTGEMPSLVESTGFEDREALPRTRNIDPPLRRRGLYHDRFTATCKNRELHHFAEAKDRVLAEQNQIRSTIAFRKTP